MNCKWIKEILAPMIQIFNKTILYLHFMAITNQLKCYLLKISIGGRFSRDTTSIWTCYLGAYVITYFYSSLNILTYPLT